MVDISKLGKRTRKNEETADSEHPSQKKHKRKIMDRKHFAFSWKTYDKNEIKSDTEQIDILNKTVKKQNENAAEQQSAANVVLPTNQSDSTDKASLPMTDKCGSAEQEIKKVAALLEALEKQGTDKSKSGGKLKEKPADIEEKPQVQNQTESLACTDETDNEPKRNEPKGPEIESHPEKPLDEKVTALLKQLDIELLEDELKRYRYKKRYISIIRSTINGLVVTAAFAILIAMLWLPVLQIYGSSMTPYLSEGDVVVTMKDSNFETGDLVAFYYGNKLLVKRCIAGPTDWIDIDKDGFVKVNGKQISEPYVSERDLGECDLEFPYQIPEEHWFLMGDHRKTSVDSRSKTIGAVSKEQIVGKVFLRVWPINKISWLA